MAIDNPSLIIPGMWCCQRRSPRWCPKLTWCQKLNGVALEFSRVRAGFITWSMSQVCTTELNNTLDGHLATLCLAKQGDNALGSVCPSGSALTPEPFDLRPWYLVCRSTETGIVGQRSNASYKSYNLTHCPIFGWRRNLSYIFFENVL